MSSAASPASYSPVPSECYTPRNGGAPERAANACRFTPELESGLHVAIDADAEGRKVRKSCDRCHQQKLRCSRDQKRPAHCLRCQRAGVECVYSVRESKQSSKRKRNSNDHGSPKPITSTANPPSLAQDEIEVNFNQQLLDHDDFFDDTYLPTFWQSDIISLSTGDFGIPTPQNTRNSAVSMASTVPVYSGPTAPELGLRQRDEPSDPNALLSSVYHDLEVTYTKMLRDQTNHTTQNYPVAEIFGIFERFVECMAQNSMKPTWQTPQTPLAEYMRTKQAALAAQCYVLSMKLMASITGQLLQNLLVTPMPEVQYPSSNSGSSSSETTRLGDQEVGFLHETSRIPKSLTLGDLFSSSTASFQHVLRSAVEMVDFGTRLLGKMEQLLGVPSRLGIGGTLHASSSKRQAATDLQPAEPSLPARLVASIWEDEANNHKKSVVTHFRRCRAAMTGLSKSNS
ncbi:hypothetical protein DHEL01_v211310 [Diaporthe helianthi]|uniref:Zn(2)-C6 fungal-type domain-containing protein n=1 Tax=Diaporthe helianthi TaxID=158607 RepID=A0A2P5HJ68_DIAHE|nr:hypothetical protein DHEL01_v211310 [Diaporthe helianthi]